MNTTAAEEAAAGPIEDLPYSASMTIERYQAQARVRLTRAWSAKTRKHRKRFENQLVRKGEARALARVAARQGFLTRTMTIEEAEKFLTPEMRAAINEEMKKDGAEPAF